MQTFRECADDTTSPQQQQQQQQHPEYWLVSLPTFLGVHMTEGGQRSSKLWTLSHDVVEVRDGEERYSVPSSMGSSIPRQPSGHGKEKRWWRPVSTGCSVRPGRGAADVVWTHRWISAKATHFVWDCHVLGLDMSKAFDTISRTKLLAVMSEITGPDEACLIHHLLYGTTLSEKVGATSAEAFVSTLGTPQGDGLSPVLFFCYLEAALRETRSKLPPRPDTDAAIPPETGYADDISFFSTERQWLANSLPVIADGLGDWSLNVNSSKTEWLHISASTTEWRRSKQLGSLLGEEVDLSRRMDQASTSYGRMYSLWIQRQLASEETRLRLYNAIFLPTLLYNCET
ncbi:uncharacterized protein LOC135829890 [Sycon ciliatum]|uniref:uncharacterized protein LOC135829890 n=1 Tax=Sycon ciliatum TaxID=27933 RepID=UPI0031F64B83